MKLTIQINKLHRNAAYYDRLSFNIDYGGVCYYHIEPFEGTYDNYFYYVQKLENGMIEITGEGYIASTKHISYYRRCAKKKLKDNQPMYYWIDENGEIIEKTSY